MDDVLRIELHDHTYFLPWINIADIEDIPYVKEEEESKQYELTMVKEVMVHSDIEEENAAENVHPIQPQLAVTYTTLPGVQLKSRVFMDNLNFRYYKKQKRNNKIYLICENQRNRTEFCPATACISTDINDNSLRTLTSHNHLPPSTNISMVFLRRAHIVAKSKSRKNIHTVKKLYDKKIIEILSKFNYKLDEYVMKKSEQLDQRPKK